MKRKKFPDNILVAITPEVLEKRLKDGWKPSKKQIINHKLINEKLEQNT